MPPPFTKENMLIYIIPLANRMQYFTKEITLAMADLGYFQIPTWNTINSQE